MAFGIRHSAFGGPVDAAIQFGRGALAAVIAHARTESPRECCGFLLGTACLVREAVPARNIAAMATTKYLVDPQDHFDALRDARGRGLEIVGFYHSHPRTQAAPSETDRSEASYPGHLYLIVSLAGEAADVRLFRFAGGNFTEVQFVTVD